MPALRSADLQDSDVPRLAARDLVFSGTSATGGEAQAVVFATGMHTEIGRIAALSERVKEQPSPLERQVRRVAWLIAAIAVGMAIAFVPLAIFGAGLSVKSSVVFAVGLLAGNVPEGLLPVITLALAVAVSLLARRGALVKRLSVVETLGSTDVICTDKTGTLTENRMRPVAAWSLAGEITFDHEARASDGSLDAPAVRALARAAAQCNDARLNTKGQSVGDPTEIALLLGARALGVDVAPSSRERYRRHRYSFDPQLKLMSTLDVDQDGEWLHTKGAPESVLPRCTNVIDEHGHTQRLQVQTRARITSQVEGYAHQGLRVLALAHKPVRFTGQQAITREQAERELSFLGLITMLDPPRAEVGGAVARCHAAGIRIIVITGDHPLTAAAIARQVGIGTDQPKVVLAERFDHRDEREIEQLLADGSEVIFARASPEAKLQIAEALRSQGHVVAMTGDGVNDAPALRRADIGVAMGRSGTDVAREAATMILTDDDFATIVTAVEAGRRVYDNVRKFIIYIFTHATPEVIPFLVFALAGGAIPIPLPVLLLLAFDVGTETLPSLALGRDPAELGHAPPATVPPGGSDPRPDAREGLAVPRRDRVAALAQLLLHRSHPVRLAFRRSDRQRLALSPRLPASHHDDVPRDDRWADRHRVRGAHPARLPGSDRFFSNPYLLLAILAELLLAASIVYAPPLQDLLATAGPPPKDLLLLLPCPLIVWGGDELRRRLLARRRHALADRASARSASNRRSAMKVKSPL